MTEEQQSIDLIELLSKLINQANKKEQSAATDYSHAKKY